MKTLALDVRFGVRMLWRNRGFTATAAVVLALGIGGSTAMFSFLDAVLLRPLDYPNPEQLVAITDTPGSGQAAAASAGITGTGPAFLALRQASRAFSQVAAIASYGKEFNLTGGDRPERIRAASASSNYFEMLGVQPFLGRSFRKEEERPGQRVAILTNRLWRNRLGADPDILGHSISLDGIPYQIVGVLPRNGPIERGESLVWTPISVGPDELSRDNYFLNVYARLLPGVTVRQASQDVQRVYAQDEGNVHRDRIAVVEPLRNRVVNRDLRKTLILLMGSVSLLLLIACANVANLLLARGVSRTREVAIRQSLGAARSRLIRQFLTESVLLAVAGGSLGIAVGYALMRGSLLALPAAFLPAEAEITLDHRTLAFAMSVSLLTGVLFGILPAIRASRAGSALQVESAVASRGCALQRLLLGSEVALMFILVIGAALFFRSFQHLLEQNPGFRAEKVLTMSTVLPRSRFPGAQQILSYESAFLARLETLPGVQTAAATNVLPLSGRNQMTGLSIGGQRQGGIGVRAVTPGYLATMGIPLLQGRFLSTGDNVQKSAVAVVNQTMARRFWPDGQAIGQQVQIGGVIHTIVGVVSDVHHKGLDAMPTVEAYVPRVLRSADSLRSLTFLVRTTGNPSLLGANVEREATQIDPDQPLFGIATMESVVMDSVAQPRFRTSLFGIFGMLSLLLVAGGIYGVVSYSVARRTREIGIRMALGAQMSSVRRLVLREACVPVSCGIVVGIAGSLALTRMISAFLFQVEPTDVLTFLAVTLLVCGVTVAACIIPAWNATRIDPLIALRFE
jgi:putative ABC transport system permease protein